MSINNLSDLFEHTLKDIYFAENYILKNLPKMHEKAESAELKAGFKKHIKETEGQVERLKQAFEMIGKEAEAEECPAIEGIVDEADELMDEIEDADTLDAALISSAQAVEHYEITRYGTLIAWAKELGHDDVAALLQQTLDEEYATDQALTKLAEGRLNREADEAGNQGGKQGGKRK